jgi:hypothetical protein
MPQLLTEARVPPESASMIQELVQDFITWLGQEPELWLLEEYENCLCILSCFRETVLTGNTASDRYRNLYTLSNARGVSTRANK